MMLTMDVVKTIILRLVDIMSACSNRRPVPKIRSKKREYLLEPNDRGHVRIEGIPLGIYNIG